MKISNSKKQLAQLLIEAGVTRFPEGAKWVAQGSADLKASFYGGYKPKRGFGETAFCGDYCGRIHDVQLPTLIPNWHQTILSRDEYFHLYPVAETAPEPVAEPQPTIEQLAADYRNRKDYADRKQEEADAAKSDAEAKLAELVAAGKALNLVISVAEEEPELVITDWRYLQLGDWVEYSRGWQTRSIGMVGKVVKFDYEDEKMRFRLKFDDGTTGWPTEWRFIRCP